MASVRPSLWFTDNLEEAVDFYRTVFDVTVHSMNRYTEAGPGVPGTVVWAEFTMNGQRFQAINGGADFPFTEAVSFAVQCADQAEVDYYWDRLTDGGSEGPCGWCKDRFGLSWQVTPDRLDELVTDPDPARAAAATTAMLAMHKIIVADLEAAVDAVWKVAQT